LELEGGLDAWTGWVGMTKPAPADNTHKANSKMNFARMLPAVGLSMLPQNSQDIGTSGWQLGRSYVGTLV
jgi:hypothetical protein